MTRKARSPSPIRGESAGFRSMDLGVRGLGPGLGLGHPGLAVACRRCMGRMDCMGRMGFGSNSGTLLRRGLAALALPGAGLLGDGLAVLLGRCLVCGGRLGRRAADDGWSHRLSRRLGHCRCGEQGGRQDQGDDFLQVGLQAGTGRLARILGGGIGGIGRPSRSAATPAQTKTPSRSHLVATHFSPSITGAPPCRLKVIG